MLPVIWVSCAAEIVAAAIRAGHSRRASRVGRWSVAVLFLGAGALVNAVFLVTGEDYADFADSAYLAFVRDTWRDLVVPNHDLFIFLLIAFEATVGFLVLAGGKHTQLAFLAAIAFHVAFLSFGWGYYLWSIPIIGALSVLPRAERTPSKMQVAAMISDAKQPDVTATDGITNDGAWSSADGTVDLFWIPLGAGGHSVRFNGIVYEAVSAMLRRRPRCDIYHCALQIAVPSGRYTVEMTPVPNRRGWERGVVVEGPVGTRWAGRFRIFRYEVRRWGDGVIPDLQHAVDEPIRLTNDADVANQILQLLPYVPALTWGRDESRVGEMWSCNSIISWVLCCADVDTVAISLPLRGRAPGWDAGIAVATKSPTATSTELNTVRVIRTPPDSGAVRTLQPGVTPGVTAPQTGVTAGATL